MKIWKHVWQGWVVLVVALFVAPPTNAQDVDPQVAALVQSLYKQAVGLMDQNNFAAACPKLEQVTQLAPSGLGGRLALGECYVGLGKLSSAWAQYVKAAALAKAAGEVDAASEARAEAEKLKPKLVMLTIHVSSDARNVPGLSVTWDGVMQNEMTWGTPTPVDLGKHILQATAPQRQSWSPEINFEKGGGSVEVRVPVLEPVPVEVKPPRGPTMLERVPVLEPVPIEAKPPDGPTVPAMAPSRSWMRPVGIAAVSVGAAGIVVGGVLGGMALSKRDASFVNGHCQSNGHCDAAGFALREEMDFLSHRSTAGWIAGGALAVTGVVLLATAPRTKKDDATRAITSWQIEVSSGGVEMRGVW